MGWKNRMLRLIVASTAVLPVAAMAGSFYIGPMVEFTSFSKDNARFQGLAPHLTLGYGDLLTGCVYLAGEIGVGPKTLKWTDTKNNKGIDLKTTSNYGASLIPGYILDNVVMIYLRLGIVATNFDSLNTTKQGFTAGIGLEGVLDPNWSVRGEYDVTKYAAINGVGHVSSGTYAVGLKYTFL